MYVECTFRILKVFPKTSRISVQTIKSATCWLKTEMHTVHKMNFTNEILLNSFENMCKSLYKPSHSLCRVQTWPRPAEEVWDYGPELERWLPFASVLQTAERLYLQLECCISESILYMYIDHAIRQFLLAA